MELNKVAAANDGDEPKAAAVKAQVS